MTLKKQQWMTLGVGMVLCVVVVVVVVLVVRNMLAARRVQVERVDTRQAAERVIEAGVTACADEQNPEVCQRALVSREAERSQTAELCRALEGRALEDCVIGIVRENRQEKDCAVLTDDARDRCEDVVWFQAATDARRLESCDRLHAEREQDRCRSAVTAASVVAMTCEEDGIDPDLCEHQLIVKDAIARLDTDRCFSLDDDEKIDACARAVEEAMADREGADADTDQDGLTDAEEARYGSDPSNVDTDGDGYPDGEEVKNGYSPIGPGTL